MIVKNIRVPIYGSMLHIVFSEDIEKDYDSLKKKFPKTLDKKRLDFIAQTANRGNNYAVIFNMKNIPKKHSESEIVNTITHETVHITSFMAKRVGLYLDVDNDEAVAYLSGWIAGTIYKTYLEFKEDEQKSKQNDQGS